MQKTMVQDDGKLGKLAFIFRSTAQFRQEHSACVIFTCPCLNLTAEPKMKHAGNTQWILVKIMLCKRCWLLTLLLHRNLKRNLSLMSFEISNAIRAGRSASQSTEPFSKAVENIDINLPCIGVASVAKRFFIT